MFHFNSSENDSIPACPDPWEDENREFLQKFCFWFGGILYCTIGILGLVGNAFSIAVYSTREMRSTFHAFLVVLAVFDIGYILICCFTELLELPGYLSDEWPEGHSWIWVYLFPTFLYPLRQIFLTASMYTTVSICLNRYIFIIHPFYADRSRRFSSSIGSLNSVASYEIDANRIAWYIGLVVVFSMIYSVPHFFEYRISETEDGILEVIWTELRQSDVYTLVYTIGIDCFFRVIIPVGVMIFTNLRIFMVLRRQPDRGSKDKQFAITLLALVSIFLVCQSGKVTVNLQEFLSLGLISECQEIDTRLGESAWDIVMSRVARILLLTNSSINFLVYVVCSKPFRSKLRRLRCCHRATKLGVDIVNPCTTSDEVWTWNVIFGRKSSASSPAIYHTHM